MNFSTKLKLKYNKALYKVMDFYNLDVNMHTQDTSGLLHLNASDILKDFDNIVSHNSTPQVNNELVESALQKEYPYLVPFRRISTSFSFGTTEITRNEFSEINGILITIKELDKINSKNT